MTLTTTTSETIAAGDGARTAFQTDFAFFHDTDLSVSLIDGATGAATPQVLNTDYTVGGAGAPAGGTVTFTAAPPSGATVYIRRATAATRGADLQTFEAVLDKAVAGVQENARDLGDALRLPGHETPPSVLPPLPARKGKLLGFHATTGDVALSAVSIDNVNALVAAWMAGAANPAELNVTVAGTLAGLKELTAEPGLLAAVMGHQTPGDGGGGLFRWDETATQPDDNGLTVVPVGHIGGGRWKRILFDFLTPQMFGAAADGVADDTAAVQAAVNAFSSGTVYFPRGAYRLTGQVTIPGTHTLVLRGAGYGSRLHVAFNGYAFGQSPGAGPLGRSAIMDLGFSSDEAIWPSAGGIDINFAFQGLVLENLRFVDVPRPIRLVKTFGSVWLRNISARMIAGTVAGSVGIRAGDRNGADFSNTVFMDGIDIVGGYAKGVQVEKGAVMSLRNFNISGSAAFRMGTAVEVTNYDQVTIETGWIEQINEPTGTNGEGIAVDLTNCPHAGLANLRVATGSIYIDNSTVDASRIAFSQSNGGWSVAGGARLMTGDVVSPGGKGLVSAGVTVTDYDGLWIDKDAWKQGNAALNGEPVVSKVSGNRDVAPTNAGLVTLSRDTGVWESGGASLKAVTTAAYHGYTFTFADLKPQTPYTFVARVRRASGGMASYAHILSGADTALQGRQPQRRRAFAADTWETLYAAFETGAGVTTGELKITADESATLYLDAYAVLRGAGNYKEPASCVPEPWNRPIPALADEATPSVGAFPQAKFWRTGGTTAITYISDGHEGREITILAGHDVTIRHGPSLVLNGSADFGMTGDDTLTLVRTAGGAWHETARSMV